jgi:enoyl-CoA hydratase/carnithine racemase|tara:strand:+ start:3996 stop:4775 length:780 start_codon:yes stop_codon:yes gene_type:complete
MSARLLSEQIDATLVLTISNPQFRNALGAEIYTAGIEAINAAESNRDVRSIIITGEGEHFCAGGNLNRLQDNRSQAPQVQEDSIEALHTFIECIRNSPKPVIAAVEGAAAGAGVSLALACDMVVAADNAKFVMAYSSVGLSPDGGGAWVLARNLPRATAMHMLLSAAPMTATALHQLGVVSQLAQPGNALGQALNSAATINARAPNVMASIKELMNDACDTNFTTHLLAEKKHFVRNLHHANGAEGIRAFLEKRPPHYK